MCGSGDLDVLEVAGLLGSLVDKSLVVAEPAGTGLRYRLLETSRLSAAVAVAHGAYFVSFAEAAAAYLTGPEQGSWLVRLDADQASLRRAAQHAAGDPQGTTLVLRLGVALGRYWWARSREQVAFGLLVPTLGRPGAGAGPGLFAAALVTAAAFTWFIDIATARHLSEQAVEVARQLGDDRLLISALAVLSGAHFFAGQPEAGRPFGQESVERARRLGDGVLLAVRGHPADQPPERVHQRHGLRHPGLAYLAGDTGDWDRAAALHGSAQAFLDRMSIPWEEADARYRRDSLDQASAHLGGEQLERACAQGMALSLDKALDLALRRPGPG